jgi:hypothetical protein
MKIALLATGKIQLLSP